MLAVSGELNTQVGGPSFQPFILKVFNSHFYTLTDPIGHEYSRRTVYRMSVGSARSPFLDAFDCPEPSVKAPDRNATTTAGRPLRPPHRGEVVDAPRAGRRRLPARTRPTARRGGGSVGDAPGARARAEEFVLGVAEQ
jgi:hypothetical protein